MQNSDLFFPDTDTPLLINGYHDPKLLITTTYSSLYRLSKAGRYFLIKTAKENSPQARAMLRREYELAIGCDHPHLVHVYIFEEDSPVGPGIVMEYIEGRTLDRFLAERPATAVRRRIFEELLSVVGYLHKRGTVHNDLKPENILITRNGDSLKLIDLGLSDNDAQQLHTPGCTPRYASPELLAGTAEPDIRSDIYLIGRLMQLIFDGRYRRIIRRCLQPKPERRFRDVECLQRRWQQRNRGWRLLMAATVTALVLLPSLLYLHERRVRQETLQENSRQRARNDSLYRHMEQARNRYEFLADSLEWQMEEMQHRKEQRDSLFRYFGNRLNALYQELKDSVIKTAYNDYASVYPCDFYNRWTKIRQEWNSLSLAPELIDQLTVYTERLYLEYLTRLNDLVNSKPDFPADSIPLRDRLLRQKQIQERCNKYKS